jgi:YD repeat-containing protein
MGRQGAWQAGQRRSRQWRPQVAAVATAALVLPALVTMPTTADAAAPSTGSAAPAPSPTKVRLFTPTKDGVAAVARVKAEQTATAEAAKRALRDQARPTAWPASGVSTVAVPTSGTAVRTSPGALPITLSLPPAANATAARAGASVPVRVQVFDRSQAERAGVHGTLLSITPTAGSGSVGTAVSVDYAGIANAYGGDFGGRLQLVRLPGCALTTPEKAQCRTRIAMPFHNERRAEKLTTEVDLAGATATRPVLLALTAGTKSGGGDYKATPLSVSSSWQAGGSSGSFSWSYPLRVPPAAAGPSPNLNISYDSGSVDGRTASSNNQGSAVGEGFDITSSYVERKYISCDDDGNDDKQDLCWKYDNALLVLNGKSTELVLDDPDGDGKAEAGKPEVWRLKDDDASKVEHLTGADNGARGGEHWRITTGDGTQYSFGLEKLPGAAEKDRTQSVWTVPVFGDDDGEPCHGDTFDKSDCVQAWRWNLDYVVDTHDSAMSYWYTEELNYYAKNGKEKESGTPYERGGYLDRIEYGQRDKHLFDTGTHAPQKVVFTTEERCLQQCDKLTFDSKGNWPDVPFDAICEKSESCTGRTGPSFFTRRRLTDVTTYVWKTDTDAGTPGYQPVDSWKLDQSYLDPGDIGDASDQTLWLNSIVHSGRVGPDKELPPVTFTHEWKKNRVDKTDDILPLNKPRLSAITAETGAITTVTYSEEDCDAAPEHRRMPTAEDDVTLRCYPVKWRPHGGDGDPTLDWFHKYVVTDVVTTDPTGGSRPLVYHYAYDAPAWHYTEDPLTTPKERTWSQWRGYRTVTTLAGEANELTPSKTVTVYLQGMNRDRTSTGRRSVTVKGITAPPIADDDQLSGFARETVTYNGADEISGTINDPWIKQTALRHYSWLDVSANYVRTAATHVRTRVTSGAAAVQRTHTTTSSFDEYGMPVTVEDRGDDGKSGDETCTRTWYARNDTVGLTTLVGRARTLAVACSDEGKAKLPADSTTQGDVVSDSATAYDVAVWAAQQAPTKGDALWSGRASGYAADGTPTWQTVTTNKYDKLGRLTDATDVKLNKTHTAYIPAEGGPLVQTEVTNPKGFTTVTVVDPAWGVPTTTTDPNSKITKAAYDQFGRLSKVHLPDTSSVTGRSPNIVYEYHLSQADASWVSTSTLRGNNATQYNTRYEIFDALLRVRQTAVVRSVRPTPTSMTTSTNPPASCTEPSTLRRRPRPVSATTVRPVRSPTRSSRTASHAGPQPRPTPATR